MQDTDSQADNKPLEVPPEELAAQSKLLAEIASTILVRAQRALSQRQDVYFYFP